MLEQLSSPQCGLQQQPLLHTCLLYVFHFQQQGYGSVVGAPFPPRGLSTSTAGPTYCDTYLYACTYSVALAVAMVTVTCSSLARYGFIWLVLAYLVSWLD